MRIAQHLEFWMKTTIIVAKLLTTSTLQTYSSSVSRKRKKKCLGLVIRFEPCKRFWYFLELSFRFRFTVGVILRMQLNRSYKLGLESGFGGGEANSSMEPWLKPSDYDGLWSLLPEHKLDDLSTDVDRDVCAAASGATRICLPYAIW